MATIAAAIIGAGATYYMGRQANKRSRSQKDMEELMRRNAQMSGDYGGRMLGMSEEALKPVYEYYRKLGGGDRNTMMQYLKPELETQSAAGRQAFQAASEFSPRSGIGVEATSRIPIDNAAAIARLLNSARGEGIRGLGTLGTNWGSMGMAGLGQGASGAGQFLGYERDRRRDAADAGAGAGESAYALFKLFQDAQAGRAGRQTAGGRSSGGGTGSSWNPEYMNFWGAGGAGGNG